MLTLLLIAICLPLPAQAEVLLGPGGEVSGNWGVATRADSRVLARAIETALGG